MKIPKKIKIGGHIVKIDCSKELDDENGYASTRNNLIAICKTIPQSQKESTLFHEAFHFFNTTFDDGDRHAILDSISEQFYAFLKDNNLLK